MRPLLYKRLSREIPVLAGHRVLVVGLGLFGGQVGLILALAARGAQVVVTDTKPEKDLRESLAKLHGVPGVELRLGGHDEQDLDRVDLVIPSPAVDPESPFIRRAMDKNLALDTELNLFFKLCPSKRIIGVTGSNGKTTTATLIYEILRRGESKVWLGGNIGRSLLEDVDQIAADDIVVLEISSFQLDALAALKRSPNIAVVTNVTPNHLDRHKNMDNYIAAKRVIVEYQMPDDTRVLNADDSIARSFSSSSHALRFSLNDRSSDAWTDGSRLFVHRQEIDISRRKLPGRFNIQNMLAAACVTLPLAGPEACEEVFNTFRGVEHRLELFSEVRQVRFYNDSIATNPEATVAALEALEGPFVLLLGGYDKKLPFEGLVKAVCDRPVRHVVLLGQTAPAIRGLFEAQSKRPSFDVATTFDEAVQLCVDRARPGECVLLSPACASYDMFRNFAERGNRFKQLVRAHVGT